MNIPQNKSLTPAQQRLLFTGISLRKANMLHKQNKIEQQQKQNYAIDASNYNNQINAVGQKQVMLLAAREAEEKAKAQAEENRLMQLALQRKKKNNSTGAFKYVAMGVSATTILGAIL